MQLTFSVQNQIITRTDDFKPVAKSQNYLRASFTFSDDWGDDDKIAIFHVGNDNYEMILDSENECLVPWEALVVARNMYVSVYSGDRITASEALVKILPTGYTERISATKDPSIDVYSSLLSRMNNIDKNIVTQVNVALTEAKESGDFKGDKGDPGDDYILTEADKKEIADLVDPAALIDDAAGAGVTNKTWSASKITSELENAGSVKVVTVTGTTPIIQAEANTRYMCGEVSTLDFTPPASGICDVIFTSGSTPTVVTLPNTVKFPDGKLTVEADTTYEINILDGIYGVVMAWT